jgi:hypothetical protein
MRKAPAVRAALVLVGCLVSSAITIASGCGTVAKVQARDDMMQAKSAYTQCLTNNSSEPSKCAGLKEAFEADLQAYRATASGVRNGTVVDVQTGQ